MSKAIYCDHCEKLFMSDNIKTLEIKPFYNEDLELDLCNECHDQLEAWIYGKFNVEVTEDDALHVNNNHPPKKDLETGEVGGSGDSLKPVHTNDVNHVEGGKQ